MYGVLNTFQNILTFTHQQKIHTLFCLFLKLPKAFSVSLNRFGSSAKELMVIVDG